MNHNVGQCIAKKGAHHFLNEELVEGGTVTTV